MIVMNNLWGAVMDMHAGVRRLREATYSKETQSQTGPTKTRPNQARRVQTKSKEHATP